MRDKTLGWPMREVEWPTCRCRLERSTTSPSTMPMVPMPAPAMYCAAGQPRPPAPMIRTLAFRRRSWAVIFS